MQKQNNPSKSFTGNSLYIFVAKFFPALALSIVWIYASKEINAKDYGLFQKFWTQLFVLATFGTIGFPVFILTYSPAKAISIIRKINAKAIGIYILFLISLATLFAVLQEQNQSGLGLNAFLLLAVFTALILSDAMLIVFKSFKAIIAINFFYSALFCLIHFRNIYYGFDLQQLLLHILILCIIRLAFCLFFIRKGLQKHRTQLPVLESDDWGKIKALWIQLGINDIITILFRWIDKFVLSLILAKELFAVYFNGTTEIPFLPILFSAVSSAAVQHWANEHFAAERKNKIPLLHYSARILSSIMFPLFFFFILFRVEFLTVVFSPNYTSAVWIFVCAQLVLPVRAYPFTAILQSEHRGDIINKGALIDLIMACILIYPLYLLMGLPGVALSFVLSTYWQAAYYLVHTSKIMNTSIASLIPGSLLLRKFLLFGIIMVTAFFVITHFSTNTLSIFIAGCIVLISTTFVSLWYDWKQEK